MASGVGGTRVRPLVHISVALVMTSPALLVGPSPGNSAPAPQPSWGQVRTLTSGSYRIDQVRMAVHPDGTYTVVWVEQSRVDTPNDGWNNRVMAVDVEPGGASEPVVLGGVPGSIIEENSEFDTLNPEAGGLQIAIDAAGLTTVVWSESRTDGDSSPIWGPHVLEVHRADAGEWSSPARLTRRRGIFPKLAVSPAGHAVVVWNSLRRNGGFSTFRAPGGPWHSPVRSVESSSSIGVDSAGVALAASRSGSGVRVSRLIGDGSGWVEQVTLGQRNIGPLDLAVNARGEAVVAWRRSWGPPHGEGWGQVDAANESDAGRWGRVRHVSAPKRRVEMQPTVVIDRRGRAVATWVQGADSVVKVARRSTSGAWRTPVTLGRGALPDVALPANLMASNPRGDTLVSWLVLRDQVVRIDAAYRARGGSWHDVGLVSPREADPGRWGIQQAAAAMAPGGNAGLAWPSAGRWPAYSRRLYFREFVSAGRS